MNRRWWNLEMAWIGAFLLGLVGAVWYQDTSTEISTRAYEDVARKVSRYPVLKDRYRLAYADSRITRAEYRALHRAYRKLQAPSP